MKKLIMLAVLGLMSSGMFAGTENESKKDVVRMRQYGLYCDGVRVGTLTCDCSLAYASFVAGGLCI